MTRTLPGWLASALALILLATIAVPLSTPTTRISAAPLADAQPTSVRRDVTYCTAGGVELKMDIYEPRVASADTKPAPAVVYVHGGGWVAGDKAQSAPWVAALASQGYFVASINYRLAPDNRWPAQIEDVKCAVRHLRTNAATYGIDPDHIGAWGDSAGGHLVALLGLAGPEAGFEGDGGYANQSSRVQAVVDMFGPTDFLAFGLDSPQSVRVAQALLGTTPDKAAETLRLASPVTYVSKDAPPFLLLHGDKDTLIPPSQSQELYDLLTKAGASANLVVVKNAGHGFVPDGGVPSPSILELSKTILDFFNRNLRTTNTDTESTQTDENAQYFPETGVWVNSKFMSSWQSHGGLAQQGYPISNEIREKSDTDGKVYRVQYFERSVLEAHPENQAPYDVLLQLLGDFRYKQKYPHGAPGQVANTSPGSVMFAETGKRLGGKFLEYWQTHGGVMQQGYPISDEFQERSDLDGKTYTVQYFERAVFESHPENRPPYDVLLSQLGKFRYNARYGAGH